MWSVRHPLLLLCTGLLNQGLLRTEEVHFWQTEQRDQSPHRLSVGLQVSIGMDMHNGNTDTGQLLANE